MIIVGINDGHDGSVCVVRDGNLISAISTERITRVKKQAGITDEIIKYALDCAGISASDIDFTVESDCCKKVCKNDHVKTKRTVFGKDLEHYIIPHHLAHCASAYYTSNFSDSHCISMDCSCGSPEFNSLVARGEGNKLYSVYCPNLLIGVIYGIVTERLGFGDAAFKAGTTMGFAPYGKKIDFDYEVKTFFNPDFPDITGGYELDQTIDGGGKLILYEGTTKKKMDIAATVQNDFEEQLISAISKLDSSSGSENLCMSGGSFLNCTANSKIVNSTNFKNYHLFPACGDDGTAVGAALYLCHHILDQPRQLYKTKDLCYTGKDRPLSAIPDYDYISSRIAAGDIIGWFQGRSEFGPRALGNRSILADPRKQNNKEIINHVIKNREWFRPFAPIVLEEYYKDWFDFPFASPYMLYTAPVKQPNIIPAITHVDGTSRFQTINEETNEHCYNLIKSFNDKTGVPLLINTSFNDNGQPIVETEDEAIQAAAQLNLDMVVINGKCLTKTGRTHG